MQKLPVLGIVLGEISLLIQGVIGTIQIATLTEVVVYAFFSGIAGIAPKLIYDWLKKKFSK